MRALKNKKAADQTIWYILAIVVLVVLALLLLSGVLRGNTSLTDALNNLLGRTQTVDSVVSGCRSACSAGETQRYAYCNQKRDLIFDDKSTYVGSCYTLRNNPGSSQAGIAACPQVDCSEVALTTCGGSLLGQWVNKGTCTSDKDKTSEVKDSQGNDITKKQCCLGNEYCNNDPNKCGTLNSSSCVISGTPQATFCQLDVLDKCIPRPYGCGDLNKEKCTNSTFMQGYCSWGTRPLS